MLRDKENVSQCSLTVFGPEGGSWDFGQIQGKILK